MWIFGLGLMLVGVFLLVVGGIFFLTIILIPFAIIAALIGIGLLIVGGLAALIRGTVHVEHHTTPAPAYQPSQTVKYCTRCGAPNPKEAVYCANCGKQFLE
jgi:ribosomal protein L40E